MAPRKVWARCTGYALRTGQSDEPQVFSCPPTAHLQFPGARGAQAEPLAALRARPVIGSAATYRATKLFSVLARVLVLSTESEDTKGSLFFNAPPTTAGQTMLHFLPFAWLAVRQVPGARSWGTPLFG